MTEYENILTGKTMTLEEIKARGQELIDKGLIGPTDDELWREAYDENYKANQRRREEIMKHVPPGTYYESDYVHRIYYGEDTSWQKRSRWQRLVDFVKEKLQ